MSVRVLTKVLSESTEKLGRRLILIVLADAASDDGVTWIGQEAVAAKAGLSRTTVTELLRGMASDGAVEVRKAQRGQLRINVHRILLPGLADVDYDRLPFKVDRPFTAGLSGRTTSEIPTRSTSEIPTRSDSAPTSHPPLDDVGSSGPATSDLACPRAPAPLVEPLVEPQGNRNACEHQLERADATQALVGYFVDACSARGVPRPPRRAVAQMARAIRQLVDERLTGDEIRAGIARMLDRRIVQPTLLPQFVVEAHLPAVRSSRDDRLSPEEMIRRAQRLNEGGS